MSQQRHAVLMGDPSYFRIVGGANPFTRDAWGRRKFVDRQKAIRQWHDMAQLLTDFGVDVYVIPPEETCPGLVYPANAGVRIGDRFVVSNLLPSRKLEEAVYEKFLRNLGLLPQRIGSCFEGEADFFPVGEEYIFTYGGVLKQRFVPAFHIPPWKRIYGFRSEHHAMDELKRFFSEPVVIHDYELMEESHYHGDTVFCSFGEGRRFLLVYLEGLTPLSRERCLYDFKNRIVSIPSRDALFFAANSFQIKKRNEVMLIMPMGVSQGLIEEIESKGLRVQLVDVSEFLKKGGGAVKCMIGDVGILPDIFTEEMGIFRSEHLFSQMEKRAPL